MNSRSTISPPAVRSSIVRRTIVALLSASAVVVLLAACTDSSDESQQAQHVRLPAKNVDQWVMPLDQFMQLPSANSDYAENLLIEPCMEAAGFEWTIPAHDVEANEGPSWNEAGTRLLNPTLAAEWGYRLAPANDTSLTALKAFNTAHSAISAAEEQRLDSCVKEARKQLPALPGSSQVAAGFFKATWDAGKKHASVISTTKKWRKCMAPLGIADLSSDPEKMPSPSLVQRFDIKLEVSPIPPAVSAEEIRIATADLACQDSTGYRKAFYDAQWDEQVSILKHNADALERARKVNLSHNKAVLKVISAHVPNG